MDAEQYPHDGRPAVDDDQDNSGRIGTDLLLQRLREIHGDPRYDIAPELLRVKSRHQPALTIEPATSAQLAPRK